MRRTYLALLLLVTMGAGPATPSLPVPPIPPEHPPLDESAPLPNLDARAPQDLGPSGTRVGLTDFRVRRRDPSMGYSPGSHFQTSEERRVIQTPGLTVRVPLQ